MKKVILISLLCLLSAISVLSQAKDPGMPAMGLAPENVALAEVLPQDKDLILTKAVSESVSADTTEVITQSKDQIVIKKGRYYLNDKKLRNKDLKALLKGDPDSAVEYKKSQSSFVYGIVALVAVDVVLVASTGFMLGILPGTLVMLPFSMSSVKHQNEAIKTYNSKHASGLNAGL